MLKAILLTLMMFFITFAIHAQSEGSSTRSVKEELTSCETNTLLLDLIIDQFRRDGFAEDFVVVISSLGKSDRPNANLHKRRLFTVKSYLGIRTGGKMQIITGIGEPSTEAGRVIVLVKGKVVATLIPKRCQDIPVAICDDKDADPQYYLSRRFIEKCH